MENEIKGFMKDLIYIIQDNFNETFSEEKECQDPFNQGMRIAYYDVLETIESQLKAFGYSVEDISPIVPDKLGEKFVH